MSRKKIAKYIGLPLQDYTTGTSILKTLKFLRESQYWDEERLYDYRLNKLRSLFKFARNNVPYYENIFSSLRLNVSDIKRLEDIEKIPILTKEVARKENMNLISRHFNFKYVKKGKTGGTTGSPIIVMKDVQNRSFTWASYYRWYEWMGINYYDREATFWGAGTVLSDPVFKRTTAFIKNFSQNNIAINSFQMNEQKLAIVYKKLRSSKPTIVKGYLSALIDLADYINKYSLDTIRPKVLSSTSETLLPRYRKYLEETFSAPLFDQYGCGELSAISYECSHKNGLHINQEHMVCEILDDNDRMIVGKSGRVIGTDLDNYVMPFIRYENGDLATMSDTKCSCGVNQPLMTSIDGREIDTIVLSDGSPVHGVFFTDILHELRINTDTIGRFQVYQRTPGIIEFRCEVKKPLEKKTKGRLQGALKVYFNEVKIIETYELEAGINGKFKYIINESEGFIRL